MEDRNSLIEKPAGREHRRVEDLSRPGASGGLANSHKTASFETSRAGSFSMENRGPGTTAPAIPDERDHTSTTGIPSPSSPPSLRKTPTKLGRSFSSRDGAAGKEGKAPGNAHASPSGSGTPSASVPIDPLSQQILIRTNTENAAPPRLRYPGRSDSAMPETLGRLGSDMSAKLAATGPTDILKDNKKKSGSFLSRLSMLNRKRNDNDRQDDASEVGEPRLSGSDARVFSSAIGAGGFIPHHKEPPRYIKMRTWNKKTREFNRVFLAQQLSAKPQPNTTNGPEQTPSATSAADDKTTQALTGAIWAMEFSKDGKYLAASGKDPVIRIWAVLSSRDERRHHEEEESADQVSEERLNAPVFRANPARQFIGHTGEVLDLSWSKNNFLLSSSMDKTVRLWHPSRQECLCAFKHKDFVTSIAFHPTDDRFFLAGSLDSQLRLWSIPDKSVAYTAQLPDMVTAVAFTPDGKTSIGGVYNGTCLFFDTEGLRPVTQMLVRSSRGKNAKGSKITGIKTMVIPPNGPDAEVKVLITSNDSRIRMYSMQDKTVDIKMKGHENLSSQIHANFSDDAQYVICGSEDKRAFIWNVDLTDPEPKVKVPCEWFEAHSSTISATAFAPTKSRQLLSASGDPLFDLCNPPPVKLMSLEESLAASQTALSDDSHPAPPSSQTSVPKETPAYLEKSKHPDGRIIVTADHTGVIKVFRQDCAYSKRRHDIWETGSQFSRKLIGQSLLGRSGSVLTRTSASSHPHSRRTSFSQSQIAHPVKPGSQMSPDQINSWRQGIDSGRNSLIGSASIRSDRSASPNRLAKAHGSTSSPFKNVSAASNARKKPYNGTAPISTPTQGAHQFSPSSSLANSPRIPKPPERELQQPHQPPKPSFVLSPAADDTAKQEAAAIPNSDINDSAASSFWNLSRWRAIPSSLRTSTGPAPKSEPITTEESPGAQQGDTGNLSATSPPLTVQSVSRHTRASQSMGTRAVSPRKLDPSDAGLTPERTPERRESSEEDPYVSRRINSIVSRLSSEFSSEDVEQHLEKPVCPRCRNESFKKKTIAGRARLICQKCGNLVEDTRAS